MRKIALVTGASRGIGRATALKLAQSSYDVCINYFTDSDAAETVRENCIQFGIQAVACKADVACLQQVEALFDYCDSELGPVSLLVNNAGTIGKTSRFADLQDQDLRFTFGVNVFGTIYCTQQAIRRMSIVNGGGGGVIINVSSGAALLGSPNEYVHYAASKGAIETLTVGLAKELGPEEIRVNAVRAGTTNTDLHTKTGNPDRPKQIINTVPLGRIAEPEDIANAIAWLSSEQARFVNGAILSVTGGS